MYTFLVKATRNDSTFSWRLEAERLLKRKWILSCSSSGGTLFSRECSAATSRVSMLVVLMEGGWGREGGRGREQRRGERRGRQE